MSSFPGGTWSPVREYCQHVGVAVLVKVAMVVVVGVTSQPVARNIEVSQEVVVAVSPDVVVT